MQGSIVVIGPISTVSPSMSDANAKQRWQRGKKVKYVQTNTKLALCETRLCIFNLHITCLKGRILSNKLLAKTSTQPGETQCDVLLLRYLVQQRNTTPQHDCLLFSTETNVEKNNSALMICLYWSVCFPRCPKPWLMKTLNNNKLLVY